MRQADKTQDHIVDDSGHNFDEAVINVLTDMTHGRPASSRRGTEIEQKKWEESATDQIDSFFDLADDV